MGQDDRHFSRPLNNNGTRRVLSDVLHEGMGSPVPFSSRGKYAYETRPVRSRPILTASWASTPPTDRVEAGIF